MKYTTHLYNTRTTAVMIPVFLADSGEKREEENVKRMNSFYDELKRSVFFYTESDSFPEGGRYFAKASIKEDENKLCVKVQLRLRAKGKTLSERTLIHTWEDGVVIEKRVE